MTPPPRDPDPDPGPGAAPFGLAGLTANQVYHLQEFRWQQRDAPFGSLLASAPVDSNSRILDVGCGAGQTLRLLSPNGSAQLVGVDRNEESLALGRRWCDAGGPPMVLVRASAHALPLPDRTFTHVLCRVALNYMRQATALAEMVRVLRPGGALLLRIELLSYDAWLIAHPAGVRSLACRVRDLGLGLVHEATGWQANPGRPPGPGRLFASRRRVRLVLDRLGCDLVASEPADGCARVLGRSVQVNLLARRRADP